MSIISNKSILMSTSERINIHLYKRIANEHQAPACMDSLLTIEISNET